MNAKEIIERAQQIAETFESNPVLQAAMNGRAVISGCNIGFMIEIRDAENGRAAIMCPTNGHPIKGPAQYQYIKQAVKGWAKRLEDYEKRNGIKP